MSGRTDRNRGIRADVHVAIRPYSTQDLHLLARLLGDPASMVHLGGAESPEALAARHERYLSGDPGTQGLFTIVVGTGDEAVDAGWIGYWEGEWRGEAVWECGWHVLPESQGAGVATAAGRLLFERAREAGIHRFIHAFPSVDNAASNAVWRKLGFELLGEGEAEYPKGRMMRACDWRFDLATTRSEAPGARAADAPASGALEIREMRQGEERAVFELVMRVFGDSVAPTFSPAGVESFERAARFFVLARAEGHEALVAVRDGELAGMIDIRDRSHVCLFFVDSVHQRHGIGATLLREALARSDSGAMTVNSAPSAVPAYLRLGFVPTDDEREVDGIRYVAMARAAACSADDADEC